MSARGDEYGFVPDALRQGLRSGEGSCGMETKSGSGTGGESADTVVNARLKELAVVLAKGVVRLCAKHKVAESAEHDLLVANEGALLS